MRIKNITIGWIFSSTGKIAKGECAEVSSEDGKSLVNAGQAIEIINKPKVEFDAVAEAKIKPEVKVKKILVK